MHCFKASLFSVAVLVAATSLGAKHVAFTDPEKAGPDFQVQGEYVGKIGGELPVGVQVIALGKHEFQGVFHTGGLPGAGRPAKLRPVLGSALGYFAQKDCKDH